MRCLGVHPRPSLRPRATLHVNMDAASRPTDAPPVVVGLGELLWDVSPAGRRWGGAPANFACHAGQLGAEAWVVSAVGDDRDGEALIGEAHSHGLRTCIAALHGRLTGRVEVALDPGGLPTYRIEDDCAWDHIPWTEAAAALAARTDVVCFGSLAQRHPVSRASIQRFLECAPPHALRVFDANLRAPYVDRAVVEGSLERADVLKANEDEWAQLGRWFDLSGDFEEGARWLREQFGLRWVLRTLGERGAEAVDARGRPAAPAAPATPLDTVGAGDAFGAVFSLGLLRDVEPGLALAASADVAAYVCTQPGGTPRLPNRLRSDVRRSLRVDS